MEDFVLINWEELITLKIIYPSRMVKRPGNGLGGDADSAEQIWNACHPFLPFNWGSRHKRWCNARWLFTRRGTQGEWLPMPPSAQELCEGWASIYCLMSREQLTKASANNGVRCEATLLTDTSQSTPDQSNSSRIIGGDLQTADNFLRETWNLGTETTSRVQSL